MSSRIKHGYRQKTASKVFWNIAPGQGMKSPGGKFGGRRNHIYAQKRAEGISWGKTYAPNGEQECARRRRQIKEGRLRAENGLAIKTPL